VTPLFEDMKLLGLEVPPWLLGSMSCTRHRTRFSCAFESFVRDGSDPPQCRCRGLDDGAAR